MLKLIFHLLNDFDNDFKRDVERVKRAYKR